MLSELIFLIVIVQCINNKKPSNYHQLQQHEKCQLILINKLIGYIRTSTDDGHGCPVKTREILSKYLLLFFFFFIYIFNNQIHDDLSSTLVGSSIIELTLSFSISFISPGNLVRCAWHSVACSKFVVFINHFSSSGKITLPDKRRMPSTSIYPVAEEPSFVKV